MAVTKEAVLKALSTVDDPDLKQDLVTLNMIRNVEIEGNVIKFTLVLTTPACPLKEFIKNACLEAIHNLVSTEAQTFIDVTSEVTTQKTILPLLPNVKNIIAVASGKGGVGKSTVTANLATALAKSGAKVGLIDADIYGPSIPTMFNCEFEQPQVVQADGKNMIIPIEQYGVKLISIGFLSQPGQAIVWRGPMASSALRQFITDCAWDELDYLLIDMPPGTGDIHLTLVQTIPVTGALIVTTPQKVALTDAKKGLAMFQQPNINVPVLGVIENMSYFTPEELPENRYYIFGKGGGQNLADNFNVPLLGQVPLVQSIRESGDVGYPAVMKDDDVTAQAFKQLAENVAQQVAIRNASVGKSKTVDISTE